MRKGDVGKGVYVRVASCPLTCRHWELWRRVREWGKGAKRVVAAISQED